MMDFHSGRGRAFMDFLQAISGRMKSACCRSVQDKSDLHAVAIIQAGNVF